MTLPNANIYQASSVSLFTIYNIIISSCENGGAKPKTAGAIAPPAPT